MKCINCGGRLEGTMTFCPFCGVRQEIDLRQIHFRDLGSSPGMACPDCRIPLHATEIATTPPTTIERCPTCHGLFFNPGELELVLETSTTSFVWLDPSQLNQIAEDFDPGPGDTPRPRRVYKMCPICQDAMAHENFGGRSGVMLDRCPAHGVWVEGGELRRLLEWWRAGGKLLYQQHASARARQVHDLMQRNRIPAWRDPRDEQPRTEFQIPMVEYPTFLEALMESLSERIKDVD